MTIKCVTDCVDFIAKKSYCKIFGNDNIHLHAVQNPPLERRKRFKHPPSQPCQPSKSTTQIDLPSYFPCGDLHRCKDSAHFKHQFIKFKRTGILERQTDHIETGDVIYVAPRGSVNLLNYPNMQRLGLYMADGEAVNAISTKHPSTIDVK